MSFGGATTGASALADGVVPVAFVAGLANSFTLLFISGRELMDKIKADMQDIGKVELHPKFDGKQMIMVIQPL